MQPEGISHKDIPSLTGLLKAPSGKEKKVDMIPGPRDSIIASFTPEEPGKNLIKLQKNKKPIKNAEPMPVLVGMTPLIGSASHFPLDSNDIDYKKDIQKITATVTRPNGKAESCLFTVGPDNFIDASFVPEEPGKHLINIFKEGQPVQESPYVIVVEGSPDSYPQVGVLCEKDYYLPTPVTKKEVKDISGFVRKPSGREEPIGVAYGPNGTVHTSFIPKEVGEHIITLNKDCEPVPNGPFSLIVLGEEDEGPIVGRKCTGAFEIPELNLPNDLKSLKGYLTRPTGQTEPIALSVSLEKTVDCNFVPIMPGEHKVDIKKLGKSVKGSPFSIFVKEQEFEQPGGPCVARKCDVNLEIPELKMPYDVQKNIVSAELTRPNGKKEPMKCDVGPNETLALHFTPIEPGRHLINVKRQGKPVKGSPFEVMVESESKKKFKNESNIAKETPSAESSQSGPIVGATCDVNLDIDFKPEDINIMKAFLTHPSGKREPVEANVGPDDSLAINFIPLEAGKHLLEVTKRNQPVPGSPFEIVVEEKTVPSEQRVVGSKCDIDFDIPGISLPHDLSLLEAKLTRPNGILENIKCTCSPDNTLSLEFTPKEAGRHTVDVRKGEQPVQGSPFIVDVEDSCSVPDGPTVGTECDVSLELPDISTGDFKKLKCSLMRPGKKLEEPVTFTQKDDQSIGINFTPKSVGLHKVIIKKDGKNVPGSPFEIVVDQGSKCFNAPIVGCRSEVVLDIHATKEEFKTYHGILKRPSGQEESLPLHLDSNNHVIVSFTPEENGLHNICIKSKGKDVPGSPIDVMVNSNKPKPSHCDIGFEIPGVDLSRDFNLLKGIMKLPSGKEETIKLQLAPNKKSILVSFLPSEVGDHLIYIKLRSRNVGNSPYKVTVTKDDICGGSPDASKVKVFGKGMSEPFFTLSRSGSSFRDKVTKRDEFIFLLSSSKCILFPALRQLT